MDFPLANFRRSDGSLPTLDANGCPTWSASATPAAIVQTIRHPGGIHAQVGSLFLLAKKIGIDDSPTFDVTLKPMTVGVDMSEIEADTFVTAAMVDDDENIQKLALDFQLTWPQRTPAVCLSVKPTDGTLDIDSVALIGLELRTNSLGT